MFPWSLIGTALKTGAEIYKNKKKSEIIMSEARIVHAEKMKRGEIEYSGQIAQNQKGDWKDEFVLLVLTSPLAILFYSVFAEDEEIQAKLDLYFMKLQEMPWWIVSLWVSVVAAIYGIKATDLIKTNGEKIMSNRIYNTQTRKKFLSGGQAKLDKDGDGKITGKDFAMLRGKKKDNKKKKPSPMMMAMKEKK
jgi:hypothetical protein